MTNYYRTDENNNPTAFTTDIAKEAGLIEGTDYEQGAAFTSIVDFKASNYYTAKLLGDPVLTTIHVIDKIGFRTLHGGPRWIYISLPEFIWNVLSLSEKRDVVGYMYMNEGGTTMRHLFSNWGQE